MTIVRRILGVVVGYAIFALSAVLLFRLSGRDPHLSQPGTFTAVSIVYGIVFAAVGGYVSGAVGGGSPRAQGRWVALIIALGATVSIIASPRDGSLWSRLAALVLMAPSAAVGGIARAALNRTKPTGSPLR